MSSSDVRPCLELLHRSCLALVHSSVQQCTGACYGPSSLLACASFYWARHALFLYGFYAGCLGTAISYCGRTKRLLTMHVRLAHVLLAHRAPMTRWQQQQLQLQQRLKKLLLKQRNRDEQVSHRLVLLKIQPQLAQNHQLQYSTSRAANNLLWRRRKGRSRRAKQRARSGTEVHRHCDGAASHLRHQLEQIRDRERSS